MERLKNEKGITLVALIITIIILIILAGVALNIALGENGIFTKSKEAVDMYKDAAQREQEQLESAYEDLTGAVAKKYTDINGDIAYIPNGYSVVEECETIDDGLVIVDTLGNEWVWVPVDNPSDMYTEGSYTINGQAGTYYSRLWDYTSETRTEKTDTDPTGTSYREPGYLSCDVDETFYGTGTNGAGFTSSTEMTQYFIDDYKAMIESVETYGGFYIGRYELSGTVENPTVIKGEMPLTETNWYRLNLACRSLGTDSTVSTMIWGTQWDATMNWLQNSDYNVADSTEWGNYGNSSFEYTDENGATKTKEENTATLIPTGSSEHNQANNIYDLAGNVFEWSQEACANPMRIWRGGCYGADGSDYPAGSRTPRLCWELQRLLWVEGDSLYIRKQKFKFISSKCKSGRLCKLHTKGRRTGNNTNWKLR